MVDTGNLLVIDVSLWDFLLQVPLLKAAGVHTVIVKLGSGGVVDTKFYKHAAAVVASGLNLQVYYWDDIIVDPVHQAEWAVAEIKKSGFPVTFLWMDAEQWWSNWAIHAAAVHGDVPYSDVPRPSAINLSNHLATFMSAANALIPGKVGVYTNWGFISSWALPMTSWIGKYPLWDPLYANQPKPNSARGYVCTWEELKANWLPTVWPTPPPGTTAEKEVGYQWSGDAFNLPGVTDELGRNMLLDLSLFKAAFMAANQTPIYLSVPVVPPVTVTPPVSGAGKYMVTVELLNIRKGPGTDFDYAGPAMKLHAVVNVIGIVGNWARLANEVYCYLPYMATVIPSMEAPITTYAVTSAGLNIRKGPGAQYDLAGTALIHNAVVGVVDTDGDWAKLTTGVYCYLPYLARVL